MSVLSHILRRAASTARNAARPALPRGTVLALAAVSMAGSSMVSGLSAQQAREPVLEEVRDLFSSEGLTLGFLLQAVVDPGIDENPARASVGQARLRLEGLLDGGFGYKLQTNHVGASTLLDAQIYWTPGPELTITAGRFKAPFSREFLTYAGDIDFVRRSRVVSALVPNRQVGVQLGGRLTEILSWSAGGFTGRTNATGDESLIGVLRFEGTDIDVGGGALSVAGQLAGGRESAIAPQNLGGTFSGEGLLYGVDARFESDVLLLAGEYIAGDWDPDVFPVQDLESYGLQVTAGWMVSETRQLLLRWDRFRRPAVADTTDPDDLLVLGFNAWPTSAARLRVNWLVPLGDSPQLHRLLLGFQIGI